MVKQGFEALDKFQNELRQNNKFNEIIEKIFQLIDSNGDGLIGLEEYLKSSKIFCEKTEKIYDEESEKKDFIALDENSDNLIDISELKGGLIKQMTEDEGIIKSIDELGEMPVIMRSEIEKQIINLVIEVFQGLAALYEDS